MAKKTKKTKKHKNKEKKKKKHPGKNSNVNSSDSDSNRSEESSGNEWVEKKVNIPDHDSSSKREEWMTNIFSIPTYSNEKLNNKNEKNKVEENLLDKPGQSSRELNPYWKDGGCGLPENKKTEVTLPTDVVGDHDVERLKKALKRAKKQAKDERRSLESIAAERWGSLDNIMELIRKAEIQHERKMSDMKKFYDFKSDTSCKTRQEFMKPSEDVKHYSIFDNYPTTSKKRWKKPDAHQRCTENKIEANYNIEVPINTSIKQENNLLTNEEMNLLASKILKAEMLNNMTLVKELTEKLGSAQNARKEMENKNSSNNVILLTSTNTHGFAQPLRYKNDISNKKGKKRTYETHADGKRVRYFEDDEKYSLTEMFEIEQMKTSVDHNAEFVQLATKSKADKDLDMDDMFMEQSMSNRTKKDKEIEIAINKQKNNEKALDNCYWCLSNNKLQKHLIISTGSKCFLSVPHFQSLTEGHCLISPIYHSTCTTLLDEDVWQEILDYCKNLVEMFRKHNQDVIFFETATNFKYYPHVVLHCVPIPYETGNFAPIYFKKAILECEKEWAMNKKLIEISKMDVKRTIPIGLPYFMVNFGMDNGFAHVIEDEKYFPKNFAQEVIGGMLDLDHRVWRKKHLDDFETQCKKVNNFKNIWKCYDSTST